MKIKGMDYCVNCMKKTEGQECCPYCGFRQIDGDFPARYLPPGTVLENRFVVGMVLGQGSFGITYIGLDTFFDSVVAVKEYFPIHHVHRNVMGSSGINVCLYEDENPEEYKKMMGKFLDEAKRLTQFREVEGIVSVHDFFFENNTAYMVMEYVEGVSLKDYVEEHGPMEGQWVLTHMDPLMDALGKIHETGLIHRDISPDNIIVKPDSSLELIDFGSAREANAEKDKSLTVVFKRGFSPVEQYRSRGEQGIWSDVYAMCATMYFCLTGTVPDEALERIFVDEMPSLLSMPEVELSRSQKKAVMKGISVRAQERYSNISELQMALQGKKRGHHFTRKIVCAVVLSVFLTAVMISGSGRRQGQTEPVNGTTVSGRPVDETVSAVSVSISDTERKEAGKPVQTMAEESTYKVPSVLGLSYKKAEKKLEKKKMKVTVQWVESEKDKNTVISQSVKKGKAVKAGKRILLKVSKGKKVPDPTPSPRPKPTPVPTSSPGGRDTKNNKPAKKQPVDELDGMIN